jgi:hypothetical protein
MKLEEISLLLAKYSLPYATFSLSVPAIKLWYELFREESILDLEFAFRILVKQPGRLYFPTPGEVTEAINSLHREREVTSGAAWALILKYAQNGSEYRYVQDALKTSGDKATLEAINILGWDNIKTADVKKDLPWIKKDFERHRKEYVDNSSKYEHIQIERDQAKLECSKIFNKLIESKNGNV